MSYDAACLGRPLLVQFFRERLTVMSYVVEFQRIDGTKSARFDCPYGQEGDSNTFKMVCGCECWTAPLISQNKTWSGARQIIAAEGNRQVTTDRRRTRTTTGKVSGHIK